MKLLKLIIIDFSSSSCNEYEITIMPTELIAVTNMTRQDMRKFTGIFYKPGKVVRA